MHGDLLAIEDYVGELRNPVAKDEQTGVMAEHEIELDVAMTEDEVIDVRMSTEIVLSVEDKVPQRGWTAENRICAGR